MAGSGLPSPRALKGTGWTSGSLYWSFMLVMNGVRIPFIISCGSSVN